jgi:uncharacterized protein YegJ (DUF2314 family)
MIVRMLAGVASVLVALVGVTVAGAQQQSQVIMVPEKDPVMAAAISKGRATLGGFWQALEKSGLDEADFAPKVGLPTGGGSSEHIWINVPKSLKDIRFDQRIEIPEPLISDWMYRRSGKIVGGYTIRALLPRLPPHEAAQIRAMLAEP